MLEALLCRFFWGLTAPAQLGLRAAKSLEHRQMSDSRQAPGDSTYGYCILFSVAQLMVVSWRVKAPLDSG